MDRFVFFILPIPPPAGKRSSTTGRRFTAPVVELFCGGGGSNQQTRPIWIRLDMASFTDLPCGCKSRPPHFQNLSRIIPNFWIFITSLRIVRQSGGSSRDGAIWRDRRTIFKISIVNGLHRFWGGRAVLQEKNGGFSLTS